MSHRVKLLNIDKNTQAVVVKKKNDKTKLDTNLEITIHTKHSNGEYLQFIAPFQFEAALIRNKTFLNDTKLIDFIKAVTNHQMQQFDILYKPFAERKNLNLIK